MWSNITNLMTMTRRPGVDGDEFAVVGGRADEQRSQRKQYGRQLDSGNMALESPDHQDRSAHEDDDGGGPKRPECGWWSFTVVEEDGPVHPRQCSKIKMKSSLNSTEQCNHKGQNYSTDNSLEPLSTMRPWPPTARMTNWLPTI